MKRNRVTTRTERKEGLEIVGEIEAGDERDGADTDLIQRGELLTLIHLQPPHLSLAKALTITLLNAYCTYTHLQAQNPSDLI